MGSAKECIGPRLYTSLMKRSPPEGSSHSTNSIEAARQWLRLILIEHDVPAAWRLTAPEYRLALVQAIIFLNEQDPLLMGYERDDLARGLAVTDPDHPLWASFASLLAEEFLVDLGAMDPENLAAATARPIAPGLELVLIPHRGGDPIEPPEMQAHGILLKFQDDGWAVAGLSGRPAVPGWPPDLGY
jgi:hypothetical protein